MDHKVKRIQVINTETGIRVSTKDIEKLSKQHLGYGKYILIENIKFKNTEVNNVD